MPDSLRDPAMQPVWQVVHDRLELRGDDNRGRVKLPELTSAAKLTLAGLLPRPPAATLDLAALEDALVARGLADDLAQAVEALGFPLSRDAARRRAARRARADARDAARSVAARWPEPWAAAWIDEVSRAGLLAGLDPQSARLLVESTRRVIDRLTAGAAVARADLAAELLGSSHALDRGTALEAACARALARTLPADIDDVWGRAGVQTDQVSGAALTWALPVTSKSGLGALTTAATALGVPVHLTQLALRRHPVEVPRGTVVLVAENPRVVEAAAQAQVEMPVVTTNGNPSAAVRLLLDQLLGCGAIVRYHGDFDVPGVEICARMHRLGLQPWRMTAADYRHAVDAAEAAGVELPLEERTPPPTPWDPGLAAAIVERGRIVHEERLLHHLLT